MRKVIKSGNPNQQEASLLIVYTLAKALGISPLEIYKMPSKLVNDLLTIHGVIEQIKSEEMEKSMSDVKKTKW